MLEIGSVSSSLVSRQCGNPSCDKIYKTLLKCTRCRLQVYCGIDCQKADWPNHKKICKLKAEDLKKKTEPTNSFIEKTTPIPGLRLIENFISNDLHNRFIEQMAKGLPEKNNGHFDGYEFEDNEAFEKVFNELTKDIFTKLKSLNFFANEKKPLQLACTLIGYEKDGFITKHIDSPLLSRGDVIVISFKSPVVVNFYSEKKIEKQQHKIFVPPKSMYCISGEARYDWSHAILSNEDSYNSKKFERGTRYVVLFTPPGPLYTGELIDY